MVKIIKNIVPEYLAKKVSYNGTNKRLYITIHETDNPGKGADAKSHGRLQAGGNSREASWQYQVDEKNIVQSFEDTRQCWAGGDGHGNGNMNSIHIEICVNSDGDFKKAVNKAIELSKYLMGKYNIPSSKVVQHNHWSGKNCPRNLRSGAKGVNWNQFKSSLSGKSNVTGTSTPNNKPKPTKPSKTSNYKTINGSWTGQTLVKGLKGRPVKDLQTKLATHNPPFYPNKSAKNNGIDNFYGDDTENAVYRFQSYYGLGYDGKAGKEVYAKLGGTSSKPKGKSISQMATEIINGDINGHEKRRKHLGISNTEYQKVRSEVNKRTTGKGTTSKKKTSYSVGSYVTLKNSASTFATGQSILSNIKGKKYKIIQVKKDRVLLGGIMSWVKNKDVY